MTKEELRKLIKNYDFLVFHDEESKTLVTKGCVLELIPSTLGVKASFYSICPDIDVGYTYDKVDKQYDLVSFAHMIDNGTDPFDEVVAHALIDHYYNQQILDRQLEIQYWKKSPWSDQPDVLQLINQLEGEIHILNEEKYDEKYK